MQDKLEEMLRRQRAYAGYFHSRGDQVGTERGVVDCWLQARFKIPEEHYTKLEPRPNPLDPPDVVLTDMKGQRIGIEVTELVDVKWTPKVGQRGTVPINQERTVQHVQETTPA